MEAEDIFKNISVYLVAAVGLLVEQFVEHPAGMLVSIFTLLYAYDKWKTQKTVHKIKKEELREILLNYERNIKLDEKREKGSED